MQEIEKNSEWEDERRRKRKVREKKFGKRRNSW